MVDPKQVKRADLEEVIRDYDARLIREMKRIIYIEEHGADWLQIEELIGFMDKMQRHRRGTLYAYKNAGGYVKDLHDFGAHAVATAEEEAAS